MAQFKLDFSSNLSARRLHEIAPGRRVNVATSTTTLGTTDPPQGVRGEGRDLLLPEKPRPRDRTQPDCVNRSFGECVIVRPTRWAAQ